MEVWKDIKNFEGLYQVSNQGRLKSLARLDARGQRVSEKILKLGMSGKTTANSKGYPSTRLNKLGVKYAVRVHRLVADAFLDAVDGKLQVDHIDGNTQNNWLYNLRWLSGKENMIAARDNGLLSNMVGSNNPASILNESKVVEIKHLLALNTKQQEIASLFGVKVRTIRAIKSGQSWGNVL